MMSWLENREVVGLKVDRKTCTCGVVFQR